MKSGEKVVIITILTSQIENIVSSLLELYLSFQLSSSLFDLHFRLALGDDARWYERRSLLVVTFGWLGQMESIEHVIDLGRSNLGLHSVSQQHLASLVSHSHNTFFIQGAHLDDWNIFSSELVKELLLGWRQVLDLFDVDLVCHENEWFVDKERFDVVEQRDLGHKFSSQKLKT